MSILKPCFLPFLPSHPGFFLLQVNSIVVPTDDAAIKVRLRELKEPICK